MRRLPEARGCSPATHATRRPAPATDVDRTRAPTSGRARTRAHRMQAGLDLLPVRGLPLILEEWPPGATLWDYLEQALVRPTSALLVSGERTLAAEFPTEAQARTVLGAIGHGERTFTLIGRAAGDLNPGSVKRSLELLTSRRMVAVGLPLSTRPSRESRYHVADPYLRFWLSFIGPGIPMIERGRGDRVLESIRTSWTSWRGRAVEPVIREALWRLTDDSTPLLAVARSGSSANGILDLTPTTSSPLGDGTPRTAPRPQATRRLPPRESESSGSPEDVPSGGIPTQLMTLPWADR